MTLPEPVKRGLFVQVMQNNPQPDLDFTKQFIRIIEKRKCVQVVVAIPKKEIY